MKRVVILLIAAGIVIGVFSRYILNDAHQTKETFFVNIDRDGIGQVFEEQTQQWKEAYNSGNAEALVPLYADSARYVSSHVPGLEANGREASIANFQNGINTGGHIDTIKILSSEISSDLATLYCYYQATNSSETVNGRNLLVLRKIDNKWLIVLNMTVV